MFETSSIEINQEAYRNNIEFIKNQCGPGVRFCSVVKGNAYGHGILTFVKMAIDVGVDYFAVYSTDEAYRIRSQISDQVDVMIMGNTDNQALQWSIENGIEIFVFDLERLRQAIDFAKASNKKAKIHIEVETGMNRTGFLLEQLQEVLKIIKENDKHIDLIGFCTHYAGAESLVNDFRVQQQIQHFEEAKIMLANADLKAKYIHSACSAAMINYPETVGDLVRIGIMQYGFWPNEETLIRFNGHSRETDQTLKRLITWKSQ
ncbi:MAG: alanine racemase, partial [Bacteroidetes bacterium]|nr:alanine racemase [Bacteroidota bacterium]